MKKVFFLIFALALGASGLKAQGDDKPAPVNGQQRPKPSPEQRAKQAADNLNQNVQLSPEQYAKILEINKNFFVQREALRASAKDGDDAKNKIRALAKDREEKTKAVLTPEQVKKEQEARAAHQPDSQMNKHE